MKRMKCYIYTRVSTSMQVDGYSLDAQKDKLRKYAEFQNMLVAGEYCDEGKSGKNIEGRPEFLRMLRDIESGKDGVSFVLVFKLSRFGRNAADVLTSLQRMQDFGVNLICVEDGIDSSKDSGKLMISVLSAVAEIERENILVQTMEGRRQKAREGKWNGGFAPTATSSWTGSCRLPRKKLRSSASSMTSTFTHHGHRQNRKLAQRARIQQDLPPQQQAGGLHRLLPHRRARQSRVLRQAGLRTQAQ